MSTLEAVLAQYEKNNKAAGGNSTKIPQEERLQKYFAPILPKGVTSGEKRIRILPSSNGGSPFTEVFFHEVMVDGSWLKLYDPKQEGKRSPLNEVYDALMMSGLESDKMLARDYRARKFFIVKVIDRENESHGVKFWRFKNNYKNEGVFDKLLPLFKNKGDITDIKQGRDLIITLGVTKSGNGKDYTTITSIIPDDAGPLHTDTELSNSWVNDELTWEDVYSKKPEEYLEMVAKGEVPKWDSVNKRFISSTDENVILTGQNDFEPILDVQEDIVSDDDLPF
jgi:hypothetical protein